MGNLLKLAALLVIGILVYNYFFGTTEEKAQSKVIFSEAKDLGKAAWGLLKSEKEKFEDGKYDEAVDKVGGLFKNLKTKAQENKDTDALAELRELEKQRLELEKRLDAVDEYDKSKAATRENEAIKRDWDDLLERTEALMKRMEEK
ncbi:MAG: hypothetical protein SH848_11835 [Saprospiraceae bacterium]|nr:hypothetical protein [Saprospiraceae bacterium]MDZ4704615.1 hypothetical protein [Saprospiraceae bacterium]